MVVKRGADAPVINVTRFKPQGPLSEKALGAVSAITNFASFGKDKELGCFEPSVESRSKHWLQWRDSPLH